MKSHLKFAIIADNIIIDSQTEKMTAIGVASEINIPAGKDSATLSFVVGGQIVPLAFPEEEGNLTVKILKPDGKTEHASDTLRGYFEKGKTIQFVCRFNSISFEEEGDYRIKLYLNGTPPEREEEFPYFNVMKNG